MILTINQLKEKYANYVNPLDKIKRDCDAGLLVRLNRGLYEDNIHAQAMFLAGPILSPSYISFEYALSYYGLIPERVSSITSAALLLHKNKVYKNKFGRYTYTDIPPEAFAIGTIHIQDGDYIARIATKEKAICDSLCKWPVVHSIKDLRQLLFEDKRIDIDIFDSCDFRSMKEIASKYQKTNLRILIKLIEKEYAYE